MKITNISRKNFKSILSLVMVLALLASFGAVFAGCTDENKTGLGDVNNQQIVSKYEGLQGAAYMKALEGDQLAAAVDAFGGVYSTLYSSSGSASGVKLDMTVNLGDDLLNYMEQQAANGEDVDLSFLSKLNMSIEAGSDGEMSKSQMIFSMNGQKLLTMNSLVDMSRYVAYVGYPELSNTYLKFEMDQNMVSSPASTSAKYEMLGKAMPDEEVLTALMKRYVTMAINEIDDVEQTTVTLEEGNLKQECTKLTAKIYEEDFNRICKVLLTAAKDDAQIKKILVDYITAVAEINEEEISAEEYYAQFQKSMDDALAELNSDSELDTENYIELITYVDKDHNVIGRQISLSDKGTLFYYHTVTEGEKFAFKAAADDAKLYMDGVGTKNGSKINGNFEVVYSDVKILTLQAENVSKESGIVTLTPTQIALQQLELDTIPFENLSVQLKYGENGCELNALTGEKLLIGVELDAYETDGPDISVPSNTVDATDEMGMQIWQATMNPAQLIENLKKAGVPEDLLNP